MLLLTGSRPLWANSPGCQADGTRRLAHCRRATAGRRPSTRRSACPADRSPAAHPHAQRRGPPHSLIRSTTPVAVKIKLMRLGKMRAPYYRIVVADARTKREGRVIETIGKYHPKENPSFIEVDARPRRLLAGRRRAADRARRRDPQGHRRLAEVQGPARPAAHARRRAQGRQEGRLRGRRPRGRRRCRWRRHHAEEEGRPEGARRRGRRLHGSCRSRRAARPTSP